MTIENVYNFTFWWSILTTLLSVISLGVAIWQYLKGKNVEEKIKAQVKVWMQDANGIRQSLQRVVKDNLDGRYSSTNDVCNAVWAVESNASALYQSLYEERCVTEEEYRTRQKKLADLIEEEQLEGLKQKKDTQKLLNTAT